jgi:glycine/D-amino acid oxidase-like deaminating enzyme
MHGAAAFSTFTGIQRLYMLTASVWEKETYYAPRDFVIAGSGVVGLWTAYYLKKRFKRARILIAERGLIPSGASTRNAGFACIGSPTELLSDARKMGEQRMLEIVAMRYEGLRRIRKTFFAKEIGYEHYGGFELIAPGQYKKQKQLKNDLGWLNLTLRKAIKEDKTFRLADKKIKSFGFRESEHLVSAAAEAQLHSGMLVQALARKVQSMGVDILTGVEIKGYERNSEGLMLNCNLPLPLLTGQLVVCTNGFAKQLLPTLDLQPVRGQVLVTAPLKNIPFKGVFHFDEGFYYFRNLGDRVLLGGARNKDIETENSDEMITTPFIQEELERFLKTVILPGKKIKIEHRWTGIMAMGTEKMPIIRRVEKNVYCAVRMSGMGVALAPVIGDIISRQVDGIN